MGVNNIVGAVLAREASSALEGPFATVRRPGKPCSYGISNSRTPLACRITSPGKRRRWSSR